MAPHLMSWKFHECDVKLSQAEVNFRAPEYFKGATMFWKILGFQRLLDGLFEDAWVRLGLCSAGYEVEPAQLELAGE